MAPFTGRAGPHIGGQPSSNSLSVLASFSPNVRGPQGNPNVAEKPEIRPECTSLESPPGAHGHHEEPRIGEQHVSVRLSGIGVA